MFLLLLLMYVDYESYCKCSFEMDQINSKLKEINNNINKILDVMLKKDNTNTQKDELKKRKEQYIELWKKNSEDYNRLLEGGITPEKEEKLEELKEMNKAYRLQIEILNDHIKKIE